MTKRYDNGELVTKDRIQDEAWYPDYQCLMGLAMFQTDIQALVDDFNKDYKSVFGKDYLDENQLLRWAVLHTERSRNLPEDCKA